MDIVFKITILFCSIVVFIAFSKIGATIERMKWIYGEHFINEKGFPMTVDKKSGKTKMLIF